MLWQMLATFVFRLSFGTALALAMTSSRLVNEGFFRVHLWMLLGFNTFAALAVGSGEFGDSRLLVLAIAAAVVSYVGAVIWMYSAPRAGWIAIALVGLLDLLAAIGTVPPAKGWCWWCNGGLIDTLGSGALLGLTITSMLLGHWYLNSPSMQLEPLRRLLIATMIAILVRAVICGIGLGFEYGASDAHWSYGWYGLLALRWLSGLIGTMAMAGMAWQTLLIPNTQSATGILYVAVMFSFLGELTSQLLADGATYPL